MDREFSRRCRETETLTDKEIVTNRQKVLKEMQKDRGIDRQRDSDKQTEFSRRCRETFPRRFRRCLLTWGRVSGSSSGIFFSYFCGEKVK